MIKNKSQNFHILDFVLFGSYFWGPILSYQLISHECGIQQMMALSVGADLFIHILCAYFDYDDMLLYSGN